MASYVGPKDKTAVRSGTTSTYDDDTRSMFGSQPIMKPKNDGTSLLGLKPTTLRRMWQLIVRYLICCRWLSCGVGAVHTAEQMQRPPRVHVRCHQHCFLDEFRPVSTDAIPHQMK
uniref:Uncharacterized protein n=1 Tax=Musa acuminata TaxID=4641 RepID=Q1EPH0_MUSAC|nr:hypothetical protein MA4_106O17.40 [Musa acuminata]